MPDDQKLGNFQMLKLTDLAGHGVQRNEDGTVSLAFITDGPAIDVTMPVDVARRIAERLAAAAK